MYILNYRLRYSFWSNPSEQHLRALATWCTLEVGADPTKLCYWKSAFICGRLSMCQKIRSWKPQLWHFKHCTIPCCGAIRFIPILVADFPVGDWHNKNLFRWSYYKKGKPQTSIRTSNLASKDSSSPNTLAPEQGGCMHIWMYMNIYVQYSV